MNLVSAGADGRRVTCDDLLTSPSEQRGVQCVILGSEERVRVVREWCQPFRVTR